MRTQGFEEAVRKGLALGTGWNASRVGITETASGAATVGERLLEERGGSAGDGRSTQRRSMPKSKPLS